MILFSDVVVFQKDEEFTTSHNHLLKELPEIGKAYKVTFQLLITSSDDQNIIHFTIGGFNEAYGDRTPALWAYKGKFYLYSAIDGNLSYQFVASHPSLNTWHNIEISQLSDGSEVKGEPKKTYQSFFYNNSVKFYPNSKILDIFE